jgi:hypothetical protein
MTHYDILPPTQRTLLPQLAPLTAMGLVLYGGTAIALQLGHRESIDFDFFSSKPIDENRIVEAVPALAAATTLQREPQTWTLLTYPVVGDRPVKISFFGQLRFGRVGLPRATDGGEIVLASLDDLLGHKLKVLLQRVELKDYQDIAALIRAGLPIERGLGCASALFPNFPPADALRTLTYFEGGDLHLLPAEERTLLVRVAAGAGSPDRIEIISQDLSA